MKRKIQRLVLIAVSIILLMGEAGCMSAENKNGVTLESAKAGVIAHLKEKYGIDFECVAHESPSITENRYTFCLVGPGLDYEGYGFKAYYEPSSDVIIYDGYFGVLIRDELTRFVENSGASSEFKVFAEPRLTSFDESLNTDSSLEDAAKIYGKLRVNYFVFIPKGTDYSTEAVKNAIPSDMMKGYVRFYEVPSDVYGSLTYSNYLKIVGGVLEGSIDAGTGDDFEY